MARGGRSLPICSRVKSHSLLPVKSSTKRRRFFRQPAFGSGYAGLGRYVMSSPAPDRRARALAAEDEAASLGVEWSSTVAHARTRGSGMLRETSGLYTGHRVEVARSLAGAGSTAAVHQRDPACPGVVAGRGRGGRALRIGSPSRTGAVKTRYRSRNAARARRGAGAGRPSPPAAPGGISPFAVLEHAPVPIRRPYPPVKPPRRHSPAIPGPDRPPPRIRRGDWSRECARVWEARTARLALQRQSRGAKRACIRRAWRVPVRAPSVRPFACPSAHALRSANRAIASVMVRVPFNELHAPRSSRQQIRATPATGVELADGDPVRG